MGFEPTERFTAQTISSRSRYDHFDTSPYDPTATFSRLMYYTILLMKNQEVFQKKCFFTKALVFFIEMCYTIFKNAHKYTGIIQRRDFFMGNFHMRTRKTVAAVLSVVTIAVSVPFSGSVSAGAADTNAAGD